MQIFSQQKKQELESKLEIGGKHTQMYGVFKFCFTLWIWDDRRSGANEKGGLEDATNYSFNTYDSTLAAWTLRPPFTQGVRAKKTGGQL